MRRRLTIGLAGALGALALLPGAAAGSTAQINFNGSLFYFAAAGETNNVTIERVGANYAISDSGAAITPMAPCVAVTANSVTCPAATVNALDVRLNDLNDTASVGASVTGLGNPNFGQPGASIQGELGNDTLTGGPAISNDLFGASDFGDEPGTDTLTGGELSDSINGGGGPDQVTAGGDRDNISGGLGDDQLSGGGGGDSFSTAGVPDGADSIDGGADSDSISYSERSGGISADSDGVADDGEACPGAGCEGDNLISIENLSGGDGDDTLTGSDDPNDLFGDDGNDALSGGGGPDDMGGGNGNDQVSGGSGKDLVFGSDGADAVDGGPDDDVFSDEQLFDGDSDADTYAGGAGSDQLSYEDEGESVSVSMDGAANDGAACPGAGCEGDNVATDLEDVIGTERADTLIGSSAANELIGGGGDDTLIGRGGADGLFGDDGNDTIDGGTDVDTLDGGAGTDALRSRDNSADQVDCGSSLDTVLADLLDDPEPSCEILSGGVVIAKSAKADKKGQSAKLKVSCPELEGIDCKVKVTLKAKGKKVASGKGTVPSGGSKQVKLKLTGDGAKALADGKLKTDAKATFTDAQGTKLTTAGKVKVG